MGILVHKMAVYVVRKKFVKNPANFFAELFGKNRNAFETPSFFIKIYAAKFFLKKHVSLHLRVNSLFAKTLEGKSKKGHF